MPHTINPATGKMIRGFAAMSPERRREVARKGGSSTPADKRAFSRDHALAASAGRKGGEKSRGGGRKPAAPVAAE